MRIVVRLGYVPIVVAALLGCNKAAPELAPVRAHLLLKGQPMPDVVVTFRPMGSTPGAGALGTTDAEGRCDLTDVRGGAGVRPGEYRVHLYPSPSPAPAASEIDAAAHVVSAGKTRVPSVYVHPDASPVCATVPAAGADFEIELTPDGKNVRVAVGPYAEAQSP